MNNIIYIYNFKDDLKLIFAAIITIYLMIFFRHRLSKFLNIIDYPNNQNVQKIHEKPTPLIGGVIIFVMIIYLILFQKTFGVISNSYFYALIVIYSSFFTIGLIDDQRALSPILRSLLIFFFLVIFLPINQDLIIDTLRFRSLNVSINLNQGSLFFTIFCIFAFFNALNFSDGVNGVALSICINIFLYLFISTFEIIYLYYLFFLIILIFFNIKSYLFLGNSGTSLLSIVISCSLILSFNNKLIYCDEILFLLLLPGFDMTRVIILRLLNNKKIYLADKNHFQHYLYQIYGTKFTWIIYSILGLMPIILFQVINNIFWVFGIFLTVYLMIIKYTGQINSKTK